MAFLTEDFLLAERTSICPACQEFVSRLLPLPCTHNVCVTCLREFREQKRSHYCPICFSEHHFGEERQILQPFCKVHGLRLNGYCLTDEEPVCGTCIISPDHSGHWFSTLQEAANERKEFFNTAVGTMWFRQKIYQKCKVHFDEAAQHIEGQAKDTERQIKEEFEKLHQFLRDEERARVAALREEEWRKSQVLKTKVDRVTKKISLLKESIKMTERELESETLTFLQSYKRTMESVWESLQDLENEKLLFSYFSWFTFWRKKLFWSPHRMHEDAMERAQLDHLEVPQWASDTLIDVSTHLGTLKYRVWKKMMDVVQYTPITLDPNTAAPCLVLSNELTAMRYRREKQKLPHNPERFAIGAEMLGSEGFSSGEHSWDVEVWDNSNWAIGVAVDSVCRKVKTNLTIHDGFLVLHFRDRVYTIGSTTVGMRVKPQVVRVQLDCHRRQVSFSDPINHTFIGKMQNNGNGKLYPYFYSSCTNHPLKILSKQVNISTTSKEYDLISSHFLYRLDRYKCWVRKVLMCVVYPLFLCIILLLAIVF